jgi:hypothetical protein
MKPAPGVTFAELDSAEVVDDGLVVMAWLSNGTLLGSSCQSTS